MTRTSVRLALCVSAVAVAVSACGTVRAGAAAVVGSDRITADQLAQVVARGLADPQAQQSLGQDRPKYQRDTLARMINHDVLAAAAAEQQVSVTEGAVDLRLAGFAQQAGGQAQLEQQAAQSGIAKLDLRGFVRDLVLTDAVGDKLTADAVVPPEQLAALYQQNLAQYDQVHTAHILVAKADVAHVILSRVKADPALFAPLAAQYSLDTSNKAKGGDLPFAGRGSFVKPFEDAVFAAKPGSFLVVHTQFGYHVVHVIERHTTTLAEVTPSLRRQALQTQRTGLVQDLLRRTASRLGVTVNPRFGTWDPKAGSVVAPAFDPRKDVTSPAPAPAASDATLPTVAPGSGQPQPAPTG
ncbi:MAG: peptidylprolyl isomerase [Actinomycetota bacterium]|nr:peptidylprolyl isomerase [Actinomycetota bacterium]